MKYEIFMGLCSLLLVEVAFVAHQITPVAHHEIAFVLISLIAMPAAAALATIAILLNVIKP